jgi:hypothetical protein
MGDGNVEGFDTADSLSRMDPRRGSDRWLTPVSLSISVLIVAAFAWFLPYLYLRLNLRAYAGGYLPVVAVFPFLVLLAVNGLLRRAGIGLRRGEITVVLCTLMVCLSTLLTTAMLFTQLPAPVRAATPGNKFREMFLWSIDERLLPYTMEDKEREETAGQFDESLNWYYLGVPEPLPEDLGAPGPVTAATAPAAASLSELAGADTGYDPRKLRIPWWRWVRRQGVPPAERVAAYERLAEQIKATEGLGPQTTRRMLNEVAILTRNARAAQTGRAAHEALGGLLARLPDTREAEELRELWELQRRADRRLSIHVYVDPGDTAADRAALDLHTWRRRYDRLSAKVRAAVSATDPELAKAMQAQIERLEANLKLVGTQGPAYERLLPPARRTEAESKRAGRAAFARLHQAIAKEERADRARGAVPSAKRKRAYAALAGLIEGFDRIGAERAARMLQEIERLRDALPPTGEARTPVQRDAVREAYGELRALAQRAEFEDRQTAEALTLAIRRERDTDRHIAVNLHTPPDRLDLDRPWFGWTGPLVWWLLLLALFLMLQFCMAALLRRQWVDHEKLLFPHVELLEAMAAPGRGGTPGGGIVRNPWMWVGFAAAFLMFSAEGISTYFPAVPAFSPKELSLRPLLTDHPWTAIPATLDLHVFVIAITFLLPTEISFSVWVFVLLDIAIKVYLVATGHTYHVHEPVCGYLTNGGTDQVAGMTVFMAALIYGGRRHFLAVLRKAFGGGKEIDDSEEPLPYRGAFWGMTLSALGILIWCYVMGMSPVLSVVIFGLCIIAVMFLTRLVCELGIVTGNFQEPTMPQYLLAGTFGYKGEVGRLTLLNRWLFMTPTYSTWAFLWAPLYYGTHAMPLILTSERMFGRGPSRRRFTFFLLVLTLAATGVFAARSISVPYEEGAIKLKQGRHNRAGHSFNNCLVRDFIRKEKMHEPFPPMYLNAIVGAVIMALLLTLRHLFYWWPLHPIGYICAGLSGGVWFSVFLGWLIKRAVLKYGGGRMFQDAIPFFVGLLVGHFTIAGIWMIVGVSVEAAELEGLYSAIWCQPYGR